MWLLNLEIWLLWMQKIRMYQQHQRKIDQLFTTHFTPQKKKYHCFLFVQFWRINISFCHSYLYKQDFTVNFSGKLLYNYSRLTNKMYCIETLQWYNDFTRNIRVQINQIWVFKLVATAIFLPETHSFYWWCHSH